MKIAPGSIGSDRARRLSARLLVFVSATREIFEKRKLGVEIVVPTEPTPKRVTRRGGSYLWLSVPGTRRMRAASAVNPASHSRPSRKGKRLKAVRVWKPASRVEREHR